MPPGPRGTPLPPSCLHSPHFTGAQELSKAEGVEGKPVTAARGRGRGGRARPPCTECSNRESLTVAWPPPQSMPNPGICLTVYPTTRKGPPLKKYISTSIYLYLTYRANELGEGHDPQVCIVVTFQQSSTMLDTSPIHPSSSAIRPALDGQSSHLPSVLSQGLCSGGLHTAHASWRHEGPSVKTELVCGVVVTSASSPPVSGHGSHRECVHLLLALLSLAMSAPGVWSKVGMRAWAGAQPVLRRGSRVLEAPTPGMGR